MSRMRTWAQGRLQPHFFRLISPKGEKRDDDLHAMIAHAAAATGSIPCLVQPHLVGKAAGMAQVSHLVSHSTPPSTLIACRLIGGVDYWRGCTGPCIWNDG